MNGLTILQNGPFAVKQIPSHIDHVLRIIQPSIWFVKLLVIRAAMAFMASVELQLRNIANLLMDIFTRKLHFALKCDSLNFYFINRDKF